MGTYSRCWQTVPCGCILRLGRKEFLGSARATEQQQLALPYL